MAEHTHIRLQAKGPQVTAEELSRVQDATDRMLDSLVEPALRLVAAAPSAIDAEGRPGDCFYTTAHLYLCVANNTWRRVALSTF